MKNLEALRSRSKISKTLSSRITILFDLVPHLARFSGQTFVIKCGNTHLHDPAVIDYIARDIALLRYFGVKIILVHGCGPKIKEIMQKLDVKVDFVDEHSVTDFEVFNVLEMVLRGRVNTDITAALNQQGCSAVGVSGRDNRSIIATKMRRLRRDEGSNIEKIVELGMVGEPIEIDVNFFNNIIANGSVPVVVPIGIGRNNQQPYAINADILAAFIAVKMKANRLLLLSDVDGIFDGEELLATVTIERLKRMMDHIPPNMQQKAKSAIDAVSAGVQSVHIINGCIEHSIAMEAISDQSIGTAVMPARDYNSKNIP